MEKHRDLFSEMNQVESDLGVIYIPTDLEELAEGECLSPQAFSLAQKQPTIHLPSRLFLSNYLK